MRTRMNPEDRKQCILKAAVSVAENNPPITRSKVAKEAGISSETLITHYFSIPELKKAVYDYAVLNNIQPIILRDMVNMEPHI